MTEPIGWDNYRLIERIGDFAPGALAFCCPDSIYTFDDPVIVFSILEIREYFNRSGRAYAERYELVPKGDRGRIQQTIYSGDARVCKIKSDGYDWKTDHNWKEVVFQTMERTENAELKRSLYQKLLTCNIRFRCQFTS